MRGSVALFLAGLAVTGLVFAPAVLPAETVEDEKIRLDPFKANYRDRTGGEGFAIGLPDLTAGHHVNVTWDLRVAYTVRVIPDGDEPDAPGLDTVQPVDEVPESARGTLNFTAPADGSYWLTLTVPEDAEMDKGTVFLEYSPGLTLAKNPIFFDMGWIMLAGTLAASGFLELALRRRDRKRAVGP